MSEKAEMTLTAQALADIDEIAEALLISDELGQRTYMAVITARMLTRGDAAIIAQQARASVVIKRRLASYH